MSDVLQAHQIRGTDGVASPRNRMTPAAGYVNGHGLVNGRQVDGQPQQAPTICVQVGTSLADMEKRLILATLEQHGGNKRRAAQVLGVSVRTIYNRLRDYRLSGR